MSDAAPPGSEATVPRQRLQSRLAALRDEFERGQERLNQLAAEEDKLRATLLRISGAIQVLSEEIGDGDAEAGPP